GEARHRMVAISARNAGSAARAPREDPGGNIGAARHTATGRRRRSGHSASALARCVDRHAAAACGGVAHPDDAGDGLLFDRADAESDRSAAESVEAERPETVGTGYIGELSLLQHVEKSEPLLLDPARRQRAGVAGERDAPRQQCSGTAASGAATAEGATAAATEGAARGQAGRLRT